MFCVISYDIPDDKRRLALFKLLKRFGYRKQYSVFEAELDAVEQKKLLIAIDKIVDPQDDKVRLYRICETCRKQIANFGSDEPYQEPDVIVI